MVRLGISVHSAGSYLVGSTNHLEQVEHNRGNSSPNQKEKPDFLKCSLWVQVLGLLWLGVVVALLDKVKAALVHKRLAQLRF